MKKERQITEEFKKFILSKAKIKNGTQADNVKLGNMGSWAMLFGDCEWYVPELDMWIRGTCSGHCCGCFDAEHPEKSPCYVAKSYYIRTHKNQDGTKGNMVTGKCNVKLGHAYRTLAMMLFREDLLLKLDKQLTKAKDSLSVTRGNESGELMCYEDLAMWCELYRRHPDKVFYIYSKNYDAIRKAIKNDIIPSNVFINVSIWHEKSMQNMEL